MTRTLIMRRLELGRLSEACCFPLSPTGVLPVMIPSTVTFHNIQVSSEIFFSFIILSFIIVVVS